MGTVLSLAQEVTRQRRLIDRHQRGIGRAYRSMVESCLAACASAHSIEDALDIMAIAPNKSEAKVAARSVLEKLLRDKLEVAQTLDEVKQIYTLIPEGLRALLYAERRWLDLSSCLEEAVLAPERRDSHFSWRNQEEITAAKEYRKERLSEFMAKKLEGASTIQEIYSVYSTHWRLWLPRPYRERVQALGLTFSSIEELEALCLPRHKQGKWALERFFSLVFEERD